ncbi:MAG: phytoene desaturase family protein [Promethearchaeota archaeon]
MGKKVVVIGAGITGLSLAALLLKNGFDVVVYEKRKRVGGRAQVEERDGFTLDMGIHLVRFGAKSSLAKTLEEVRGNQAKLKFKDIGLSFVYNGDENQSKPWEVFPTGIKGILKSKMAPKRDLLKLLSKLRKLKLPDANATSVEEFADGAGITGGAREYLNLVTASMQVCPFVERASVGELKQNLAEVLKKRKSATYPVGGWAEIFGRLTTYVEEHGDLNLSSPVSEVIVDEGEAKGVVAGGEEVGADVVVSSIPVQQLFSVVDKDHLDPEYVALCENLRPTAGLSLDLALEREVHEGTGLFYFKDPVAFGVFTSNLDPSQAPPGRQLFTVFCPTNPESVGKKGAREELLGRLKGLLFRAFPGMEESLMFERPLFLPVVDGAEVNTDQYRERRPGVVVPGLDNLYLVGDGLAARGAGGDVGHNCVWDTLRAILRDHPASKEK